MMIDVLGGDFGETMATTKTSFSGKLIELIVVKGFLKSEKISSGQIRNVEQVSEENKTSLLKGAKWAAVGGLLAGPLGVLAGGLLGGKKRKVLYTITLSDGRQMLCKSGPEDYQTLLVASLDTPGSPEKG